MERRNCEEYEWGGKGMEGMRGKKERGGRWVVKNLIKSDVLDELKKDCRFMIFISNTKGIYTCIYFNEYFIV